MWYVFLRRASFGCWSLRRPITNMQPAAPLLCEVVASSVATARRAGALIRDVMKAGNLGIVDKGLNDLQTEADRSAQKCIVASLLRHFPSLIVIGEEDQDQNEPINPDWIENKLSDEVLAVASKLPPDLKNVNEDEIVVWVDPLDGTSEYTEGLLNHVTVLIGIAVRGRAVAGVIYQPYYNFQSGTDATTGRVLWGIEGVGAFGFEKLAPPVGNIICTTRSHSTGTVNDAVVACEPTEILRVGGCGHKVLLILEGKAHAYVFASPGCKKWDTCAPEAILSAMGGKLTDIHGNDLHYQKDVTRSNSGGILAVPDSSKLAWYLSKIPQSVKDKLEP